METKFDVIILGDGPHPRTSSVSGAIGLAGGLAAFRLKSLKPELNLALMMTDGVDAAKAEDGAELAPHLSIQPTTEQTWMFHESDLNDEAVEWVRPMISRSWERTTVQFPRIEKTTEGRFCAVRSDDFQKHVNEKLGESIIKLKSLVARVSENEVILANGDIYRAELVIDARAIGNLTSFSQSRLAGFHKSISYELELEQPHGLQVPVLMDATCPQLDGFRYYSFFPWSEKRVLIREAYYSDRPELNAERISRSIESFAHRRGWKVASRSHEERCSMPMPMTSDYLGVGEAGEALPIGGRGGYFHATTSALFPDSVRIADFVAGLSELTTPKAREALIRFRRPWLSRQKFYRMFNRLIFFASEPDLRYHVIQQLYEQPSDVLARYHAGRTSWGDRLRILSGRPALPLDRTLKSFSERAVAK